MKKSMLLAHAIGLWMAASTAIAAPITYEFTYSDEGPIHNTDAVVHGRITLEGSLLAQGDFVSHLYLPGGPVFLGLSLDVSGGTPYDGHYGMNDFYGFGWNTSGGTLDLTRPLFGQDIGWGQKWGAVSWPMHGEFAILGFRPEFTSASNFSFQLFPQDVMMTHLDLVSSVPEPETYALMLGGLGLLALARRRKHGRF